VIVLPFVDDLRDPPKVMTDNLAATDDQTMKMEKIVRRLKFKSQKYQPSVWRNPALEYHQKQLQALAFDEDFDTDAFNDSALPKYAGIHKAAGKLMKEWNELVNEDERAVEVLAPATKRPVVTVSTWVCDPSDLQVDVDDVEHIVNMYRNGNISKAKVAELRDYAKFHSESTLHLSQSLTSRNLSHGQDEEGGDPGCD
jgi:ATP-dependent DNA helicase 2 subunit 1